MSVPLPESIEATLEMLSKGRYVADRSLATALYLALKLGRPLFLEGEAGVGKTEIAKVLSETLGRRLIRLQCYEGLENFMYPGQGGLHEISQPRLALLHRWRHGLSKGIGDTCWRHRRRRLCLPGSGHGSGAG